MVRILNARSTLGPRPAMRRARRAEARRLEILRAAARTFRERGFASAGMREIAAEADLSPGNLYHYFRGKDEILYFCQDRSLDLMLDALAGARRSGMRAPDQLRRVIETHVKCLLDELEGSAAHLEVDALPARLRGRIIAKRDRYEHGIRRLIAEGVDRGDLPPCDPKLVTQAILGAANWTARWFRPDGPLSAADVATGLSGFLVRGVSAPPPTAHHKPAGREQVTRRKGSRPAGGRGSKGTGRGEARRVPARLGSRGKASVR